MTKDINEQNTSELLPFFVNGTLGADEHSKVAAAIASNDDLQAQANALSEIREAVKTLDDPLQSPGEAGLQRLIADIDGMDNVAPILPVAANTNSAPVWARFGGYAIAACLGALVVFVATPSFEPQEFATMASGDVAIEGPETTISVTLSQDVVVADFVSVLRSEELIIVDGPSARGVFQLADLDGAALTVTKAERLRELTALFATVDNPN